MTVVRHLPRNSVLVTCIASIGKNAVLKVAGACNQQINAVIPNADHDPKFLYYIFDSNKARLVGRAGITATSILSKGTFIQLAFPIPPTRAEEEAIAEALSDADAFVESLEQLLVKKRSLKQGAMRELLTATRRLPGFDGEWETKQLGTVLKFQVGFPFSSSFFNTEGQGIRLVKNRDLKSDDQVFYYSGKYDSTFLVEDGDLLVGMDGDFVPCLWRKGSSLLNQRIGRIVPQGGLNRTFASYYLISPLHQIEVATSKTTVKHLSHGDVERIERPLPGLNEQAAIAAVLSDMDAEVAELEAKVRKARDLKQGMMQELLTGRIRLV